MFPDEAEDEYFELVKLALRTGCEYVDLELGWKSERLEAVRFHKGHSHILASWHDWSGRWKWNSNEALERYMQAARYGNVAKLVSKATSFEDNLQLEAFRAHVSSLPTSRPLLAINMGEAGQVSRILNPVLSPRHAREPTV
ncbi:hypothetical protein L7F22_063973 [Adiantum nelumboides]|nr:hypothetical protein [Adiantum nelumboides]